MIGMAIIIQLVNGVLRTDYARHHSNHHLMHGGALAVQGRSPLGMALPGDEFGNEGRIQARCTRGLKVVVIPTFTLIMDF